MPNFEVNNVSVSTLLGCVSDGTIARPEIQRPFVWDSTKVRNLIDSLYKGYPVGYIITWKSPDVKLKDGTASEGKQVLIDGQQRITALTAALLGQEVLDNNYKKKRIKIAFNIKEEEFQTLNPAIEKQDEWIPDISEFMKDGNIDTWQFVTDYSNKYEMSPNEVNKRMNDYKDKDVENLGSLKKSLEEKKQLLVNLFSDRYRELLTDTVFEIVQNGYEKDIKELQEKIKRQEKKVGSIVSYDDKIPEIINKIKKLLDLKNPTRELLLSVIDKIVIDKDRNVEIYYKFKIIENDNIKS